MDNNPLRQYFRRPAVYITLPSSGKNYPEDVIDIPESGELPVYPMTAIDEITTKTPDALFNGTAVVELIKSCIPNIKNPWYVTSEDIEALLLSIRAASSDDALDIESTCPKCEEVHSYGVNLAGILSTIKGGSYDNPIAVGDLKIKFRPLTYKEMNESSLKQFEVQKLFAQYDQQESSEDRDKLGNKALGQITDLTMELISLTIEYIETPNTRVSEKPFILDFLRNCDRNLYATLRDKSSELKTASEIKPLDITCAGCGNQYKENISVNPVDFFG